MAVTVSFTLDQTSVDQLQQLAQYADMNRSEYLRFLIAREHALTFTTSAQAVEPAPLVEPE